MNKKSLIILSPGFAKDEQDTSCLPAQQVFVKALNRNFPSLNIIILAFQYPFNTNRYKWYGNDIIGFGGRNKRIFFRIFLWWRIYKSLKRIKNENSVIGVLSFWCTECALVGKYFARNNDIKHINWILGQDAKQNNIYVKWIRPASEELVALSDSLSDTFFKSHGIRPAYVIPNGVDINMFPKTKAERTIDIMGAGSLIPLKQYDVFVEVVAEIKNHLPDISVVLCGSGAEQQKLEELIHKYHLEKNILLTGNKGHAEVLQLMQKTKVFLHPSSYEGFSAVCLEALCAGSHVISFVKPMNNEIKYWHIVSTKEEMIEETVALLSNVDTVYDRVVPFSVDDNAKAMMRLFDYSE